MLCPSGVPFVLGTRLSGPEEYSKNEGEDKNTVFFLTLYRALREM